MFIKGYGPALLACVWLGAAGTASRLQAKTIEVETDDEDLIVVATPTPASSPAKAQAAKPEAGKSEAGKLPVLKTEPPIESADDYAEVSQKSSPRVRVDDLVGFNYFVKSGFVVSDPSKVTSIGRVIDSDDNQISYSTPKKAFIELSSSKVNVKPGDLLVVYRVDDRLEESHSGFSGFLVRNLAVVQVMEVQKNHCLIQTKTAFRPFKTGDRVMWNDDEIKRWKQARIKKALPAAPIRCYVIEGDPTRHEMAQTDSIVLTAGAQKGVVEGQSFQLRETIPTGFLNEPLRKPQGMAKVFYVGPNYSMAQIVNSHVPVHQGFEADYQP